MKTSLVLSTYNGEKYIKQQLDSLYEQTRKIDHVLIFDDKSTDHTVEIIKDFIKENDLAESWNLKVNEKNQGWEKNFWLGLRESDGDIVFLCDQDDVWDRRKIEIMTEKLEQNPDIYLLACGFETLYEEGNLQKVSSVILNDMNGTGEVKKVDFTESFMYVLRPGCTYAFRSELWKMCDEFWNENVPHDAMLWRQALLLGGLYELDMNLIQWRRYNTNSSNPYRIQKKYKNRFLMMYDNILNNVIKQDNIFIENLVDYINLHENIVDKKRKKIVEGCFSYQKLLKAAFEEKSLIKMGIIGVRYHNYFYAFRTYVHYFLMVLSAKLFE